MDCFYGFNHWTVSMFLPLDRFYGFYHWTVWWSPPACQPDWHSVCQTDRADPSGSVLTVPAPPPNVWLSSEGKQATHKNNKRNLKLKKSSQLPIYKTDDCIHAEYNHNSFNIWSKNHPVIMVQRMYSWCIYFSSLP